MGRFRSMSGAIKAHKDAGGHFFDRDVMRFFGTRVLSETYEPTTGMFITLDIMSIFDSETYVIRRIRLKDPKRIDTVGYRYATLKEAKAALQVQLDFL